MLSLCASSYPLYRQVLAGNCGDNQESIAAAFLASCPSLLIPALIARTVLSMQYSPSVSQTGLGMRLCLNSSVMSHMWPGNEALVCPKSSLVPKAVPVSVF